jgi:uncharacterized protein (TIGR02246 family)
MANAEKRKSHVKLGALTHPQNCIGDCRGGGVAALIALAFVQKAEIEAVNAKWIDFFNKGDFAGVASLYTEDATAFPPGSGMMKGRPAIEALWKSMAEQVSDPKLITIDVKATRVLRGPRDRDLQPQDQGSDAAGSHRQVLVVWEKIGSDWKLAADIWNDGK